MLLLHTSDWHLGHTWKGQTRRDEFQNFLVWLIETIKSRKVDVLLVSGDIFDTSTPSAETQSDYFNFLKELSATGCLSAIVAGNHDSPYLLDAPSRLLSLFNIYVIGAPDIGRELVEVYGKPDASGFRELLMLIGAVPFLRDGDMRRFEIGESVESREQKIINGVKKHYAEIAQQAEHLRGDKPIPFILSGHLFVAGAKTSEGVREIHVGSLGQVGLDLFPDGVDYFAFGHLHIPQRVGKSEKCRYSGSPIPMSFDEAGQVKSVVLVEFNGRNAEIEILPTPKFVNVTRIEGDITEIETAIRELPKNIKSFVEVSYNGSDVLPDLFNKVDEIVSEQDNKDLINIVRVRNNNFSQIQLQPEQDITLEQIDPIDLFRNILKENNFNEIEINKLLTIYGEIEQEVR
ncbi:MAG: exonuclease SbcCD subunit D C-terminal domain-containing protein [Planctomycetaceae bacterium]|jgi:exonuclease SbcD|nr:exonuclease SbcCD subunit D C-terminal domain-containing protein [Planctomycetaceae bacterium]